MALVDSGATGNFIDYSTVKRLGLGTKKLNQVRTVANIDGTLNRAGTITRVMLLRALKARRWRRGSTTREVDWELWQA